MYFFGSVNRSGGGVRVASQHSLSTDAFTGVKIASVKAFFFA